MTRPTRRAHRALCALPLALLLALLLAPASHAAEIARNGVCSGTDGVTVIVDMNPDDNSVPSAPIVTRCVAAPIKDGFQALNAAGLHYEIDTNGFLCTVEGLGTGTCGGADRDYWALSVPDGTGWTYAMDGLESMPLRPGDVIGLRLVADWDVFLDNTPRLAPRPVNINDVTAVPRTAGSDVMISFDTVGGATVQCRVDLGVWTACSGADSHTLQNVSEGTRTLFVQATVGGFTTVTQRSFEVVPSAAAISGVSHALNGPTSATVSATVAAGGGAQQVHVEYGVGTDHAATVRSATQSAAAGASTPVTFALKGLTSNTTFSYRVVTTGAAGTVTSAWATLTTPWRAATLTVMRSAKLAHRGTRVTLNVDRLAPGEAFTVHLRGTELASGTATDDGTASIKVRVPAKARAGSAKLVVRGAQADRIGSTRVTVTTPRKLTVRTSRTRVTAGGRVRITATRLITGERVTVRYRGKVVARGVAAKGGRFVRTIKVGSRAGRAAIKVTGQHTSRSGSKTIRVSARRR